ncbi:signal peptidase I [Actinocorallia sp. A-T 12471]|uniref:signal peptidase I n=1 Tax=Actinocorallia sp. A-T 12471 TaxID=3089813 RepID=UPI0029D2248D|nr:signal peptidase I [Actinocorallia sp. A-T 12471]MDX6741869.1 signal peptidase I [Actinocorallia sp. A-T 12471]
MTSASTSRSFFKELPFLAVTAVVLALLIRTFVLQTFYIPSGSMERTLHGCEGCTRDRVIVEKVTYLFSDPDPGDIVVFHGTGDWPREDLIKRVIATAGQTVECCEEGKVVVDGDPIDEPYLYQDDHRAFEKVTVPDGMLWVMGDHRSGSSDSRDNGFVPVDSVVGHARLIIWPVTRWDWL